MDAPHNRSRQRPVAERTQPYSCSVRGLGDQHAPRRPSRQVPHRPQRLRDIRTVAGSGRRAGSDGCCRCRVRLAPVHDDPELRRGPHLQRRHPAAQQVGPVVAERNVYATRYACRWKPRLCAPDSADRHPHHPDRRRRGHCLWSLRAGRGHRTCQCRAQRPRQGRDLRPLDDDRWLGS